jgi:tetratricopeptide (TPR) repeat protein
MAPFVPVQAAIFSRPLPIEEVRARISKLSEKDASRKRAQLYSELGNYLYKRGQMADAAVAFENALLGNPSRSERRHITLFLGKSYESSGRTDKAITAYEQALELDPKNWKRHRDLAVLYEESQLYRKAILGYEDALQRDPKELSLLVALGRVHRKMGLCDAAEFFLVQDRNLGDTSIEVDREFSFVYEIQGRFGESAAAWEKSLGQASTAADMGRFIYLSCLAKNKPLADKGLAQLKALSVNDETRRFYENLVELLSKEAPPQPLNLSVAQASQDPTLKGLIDSILVEPK